MAEEPTIAKDARLARVSEQPLTYRRRRIAAYHHNPSHIVPNLVFSAVALLAYLSPHKTRG